MNFQCTCDFQDGVEITRLGKNLSKPKPFTESKQLPTKFIGRGRTRATTQDRISPGQLPPW